MPHIIVKMHPGRPAELKQELAREMAKTLQQVLGSKPESITVGIEDIAPEEWEERVNKPDLLDKPETIFKQKGTA